MTQTISSLTGFVNKIRDVQPAEDEVLLYRGHSKREFRLLPLVLREPEYAQAEHSMLHELVASHPAEFASDITTLDQLARAQHYSLPTRLLDATWNPLVALYFAAKEYSAAGEVIVFRVKKDVVRFYDSDTVSCISNLAYLNPDQKQSIDFELAQDQFNDQWPVGQLLHFIGVEKPHFKPAILPGDLKKVVCVKPKRNTQRILVQSGAFLLFGIAGELDTSPADGIAFERIIVNGNHKNTILRELDVVDINETALFPEIERAAMYIRGKVKPA